MDPKKKGAELTGLGEKPTVYDVIRYVRSRRRLGIAVRGIVRELEWLPPELVNRALSRIYIEGWEENK